jgi:hypothetical protein
MKKVIYKNMSKRHGREKVWLEGVVYIYGCKGLVSPT